MSNVVIGNSVGDLFLHRNEYDSKLYMCESINDREMVWENLQHRDQLLSHMETVEKMGVTPYLYVIEYKVFPFPFDREATEIAIAMAKLTEREKKILGL